MKYKEKESFFYSNWKLMLHKTSAPRSIFVIDDPTIINQNNQITQKKGRNGPSFLLKVCALWSRASARLAIYEFTYSAVRSACCFSDNFYGFHVQLF
jgi:hypothetical protein